MSWLEDPGTRTAGKPQDSPLREFLNSTVVVESDIDTGALAVDRASGHQWITAYPSYDLLERLRGFSETLNHAQLTGRQLRSRVPEDVGVMYRPNEDEEITISWPRVTPVARVSAE